MSERGAALLHFAQQRLWRVRFLRFLTVGVVNTLFGYGIFFILVQRGLASIPALALATLGGVAFNFFSTGTVVFGSCDSRRSWRFAGVYLFVFLLNSAALELLLHFGLKPALAQLLLLPGFVTLSYLLNRNLVFMPAGRETGS